MENEVIVNKEENEESAVDFLANLAHTQLSEFFRQRKLVWKRVVFDYKELEQAQTEE